MEDMFSILSLDNLLPSYQLHSIENYEKKEKFICPMCCSVAGEDVAALPMIFTPSCVIYL